LTAASNLRNFEVETNVEIDLLTPRLGGQQQCVARLDAESRVPESVP